MKTEAFLHHEETRRRLPQYELAVVVTRFQSALLQPPDPIATPTDVATVQLVTPSQATAISAFLDAHAETWERGLAGVTTTRAATGLETGIGDAEEHLRVHRYYTKAQQFFRAVAESTSDAAVIEGPATDEPASS